jgi:hypothetical protein
MMSILKFAVTFLIILSFSSLHSWATTKSKLGLCGQNPKEAAISLSRGRCLGKCPSYQVLVKANGSVEFKGDVHVAVTGLKKHKIKKTKVDELIKEFKSAGFFEFKDKYRLGITDAATYELCFSDGKQEKKIIDYVGTEVGMPEIITTLENRVDEVANTAQYIGENKE